MTDADELALRSATPDDWDLIAADVIVAERKSIDEPRRYHIGIGDSVNIGSRRVASDKAGGDGWTCIGDGYSATPSVVAL